MLGQNICQLVIDVASISNAGEKSDRTISIVPSTTFQSFSFSLSLSLFILSTSFLVTFAFTRRCWFPIVNI